MHQYSGRWNHIAVTFDGGNQVKFYINGALDSTKTLSQSGINTYGPPLEIGSVEGINQIKASLGTFRISSGVKGGFPYGAFANIISEPSLTTGAQVEPPVSGSPDLTVLSLSTFPTSTPTYTPSPTSSPTATPAPTNTPTYTSSPTSSPTTTSTPTGTSTSTPTPTNTSGVYRVTLNYVGAGADEVGLWNRIMAALGSLIWR